VSRPLWSHQTEAIERAKDLPCFGLFFEVGTGKTRTCIEVLKYKNAKHKRALRTLIVSPAVVCFNWKREYAQYSNMPNEQVIVLHGTGQERLRQLQRTPSYFVVICNYETLLMDAVFNQLKEWNPEVVVLDESHRGKKSPRPENEACHHSWDSCQV
jgi:SNF2 family DNA or RNA helicase